MNTTVFSPGQRWISNTEADLGLGLVVEANHRQVTLSFPAAAEQRCYAVNNAPLTRIIYNPGDKIRNLDGLEVEVTEVDSRDERLFYIGIDDQLQSHVWDEIELDCFINFNKPQDRLLAGHIDKLNRFDLRADVLAQQHAYRQSTTFGLVGARVQLIPHQFYIAHQVAQRPAPRVLLADEVGLGKTIEAGLIIHQQLLTGRAGRVLILVPDSLLHQWLVEMLRRFNLRFSVLDYERCQALHEAGEDNPFDTEQLVLCPLSQLVDHPRQLEWACASQWDLMVVDEAHHLGWSEAEVSLEYSVVESLAQRCAGLLLLTATPEQLGLSGHFARLRLLDPDRYYDLAKFTAEESGFVNVNTDLDALLNASTQAELVASMQGLAAHFDLAGDPAFEQLQAQIDAGEEVDKQPFINALLDRYGTGRVLFRNTRKAVEGFPQRHLQPHLIAAPDAYLAAAEVASPLDRLRAEQVLGDGWLPADTRVEWLADFLKAQPNNEKVLVICAQADTAIALEAYLRLKIGLRSAVFHEGLTLIARDRAAAYFADQDEGAQVLICSEIGSEGRNFQFAHQLVCFDLPLNPDLLEQRIGRLDRIGQKMDIQIHVPVYENTVQSRVLDWLHQGLNAFLTSSPAGSSLFAEQASALYGLLEQGDADEAAWGELISAADSKNRALLEQMEQGRDRLLELNSCNETRAFELLDQVIEQDSSKASVDYTERLLDALGVEMEPHDSQSLVLRPGEEMHHHSLPGLPEEGMTATFSRSKALHREDIEFLSWEHPLVQGAVDILTSGDLGNTSVATVKLPGIAPASLLLEAIFSPQCQAPRALAVERYLPQADVRVLLDSKGNDLSKVLSRTQLSKLLKPVSEGQSREIIKAVRDSVVDMMAQADALAAKQQPTFIATSIEAMTSLLQPELERLQTLQKQNPNIRQDEVDAVQTTISALHTYLANTELRLDAVRLVITS